MKKIIFIIFVLIALFCCQKKEVKPRYFSVDKLEALRLDSFNVLFGDIEVNGYPGPFKSYNGYIDGIGFENSKDGIFISVFNSQEDALEAMQHRINMVSCAIEEGVGDELEPEWWRSKSGKCIFKNHWNTIIEISSFAPYRENVDELIFETVKEVMQRVDKLSEPIVSE